MCGIVGVIGAETPDREQRLAVAARTLLHRGPDGDGQYLTDLAGLAHTRLAVIDPIARSDQPMIDPETGSVLVFNGEIYNYRELRTELGSHGHEFRTASDTEVLLVAYRHWGTQCLDHFNGMFAFCIWDTNRRRAFVARDRLGEKPFHLCHHDGSVWFASEVKALLAAGVLEPTLRTEELYRFLAFGDLGHPRFTMFGDCWQLPPAHAATISGAGVIDEWCYWDLEGSAAELADATVHADHVSELWHSAVTMRMRSDVPLGTSLSGGPDSSAVIATVRAHRPDGELHAFTASFPGTEADELAEARRVADAVGATIHPVLLSASDLARGVDPMIRANESPVEAASQFAQYRVMQEAHDAGVVVLLDGQGADEVFGGYDKYAGALIADHALRGRVRDAFAAELAWRSVHGSPILPPVGRYLGRVSSTAHRRRIAALEVRRSRWLSLPYTRANNNVDPVAGDPSQVQRPGHVTDGLMRQDLMRWTLPRLLHYGDRNSMAWSREVRLPYLDHRLIELAVAVPAARKIVDGWTKVDVRRLLRELNLDFVANRRDKKAYMPPQKQWLSDPVIIDRIRESWSRLHREGMLATAAPDDDPLHRWRALAVASWADQFGVSLAEP
ncbi:MAG: asparagine synthase (glutamine-hydrolyzing) [Actinobacteria bacterium]|nr:asparagine synthase (glutamine-hydrolyzing) [Actinomycetota bacterium]